MITLHLITQDDQPYGSVRRCCEMCGCMKSAALGVFTDDRALFARARNFLHIASMRTALDDITVVACDRRPIAFKDWNARGPRALLGRDDGDPGDCS